MTYCASITVLISGGGSNLNALIDAISQGQIPACINRVIADRDCGGKEHAFTANIPFVMVDRKLPASEFIDCLTNAVPQNTDLIVLAGFLSIMPKLIIQQYRHKIINLHPSLLPKYGGRGMYGLHVHQAVIDAHESDSGCTVHYVDEGIDSGEIIAQAPVPVLPNDTAESLQRRVQQQEHQLLVQTVRNLLNG